MKILFALPGFHRFDRGAEVALLSVASSLCEQNVDVTVIGSGPQRPGTNYRYVRAPAISRTRFERFPKLPLFRDETKWEDATFAASLISKYRPAHFDAVVTCSFPFTHWLLRRRHSHQTPVTVFVTQNGDWPAFNQNSEYRTFKTDLLVCTNPDYFERNKGKWNSVLIPNGVDLNQFTPGTGARSRFGLPRDAPVLLMVSAFIESKRVLEAIKAVAPLERVNLVIAGDGPLRSIAVELGRQLMPGRFHVISLPAEQMPALYRSADAFLHMSLQESFGNVFLEAWATGLPVVAHDSPRLRWVLEGHKDFLCDTQDRAILANALMKALARGQIPPDSAIQKYAWSAIASQYRCAVEQILVKRSD